MTPKKLLRAAVHIDGGASGNPGPAAAGVIIRDAEDGQVLQQFAQFLGRATSNVAEYRALLAALRAARALGAEQVQVNSDSELLVRQMTGQYRVRNPGLRVLFEEALALVGGFSRCTFRHVPREQNAEADRLVRRAVNLRRDVADADD